MRYNVRQAGAAVPISIVTGPIGDVWETVLEAPDFSVPDPQVRWADDRDPEDDERRIQPGFALIEAPMMFYNPGPQDVTIEIAILREDAVRIQQASIEIAANETYLHPAPGQRLLKMDPTSTNGDRFQVRCSVGGQVRLTSTASEGAAEQHEPGSLS